MTKANRNHSFPCATRTSTLALHEYLLQATAERDGTRNVFLFHFPSLFERVVQSAAKVADHFNLTFILNFLLIKLMTDYFCC